MATIWSEPQKVWQIYGGVGSGALKEVFLKFGVALVPGGDGGIYRGNSDDVIIRRLGDGIRVGDAILLRTARTSIAAIGIIVSDYEYLEQFDDVLGLDMEHARRVRWYRLPAEYDFGKPIFGARPSRLSEVQDAETIEYARRFLNSPPTDWQTAPLPPLPSEQTELADIPTALQAVIGQVQDIVPQYFDADRFGELPTEDEMVGHFVIPFLRALGWTQEQVAIKWRYIDIALFRMLPRCPENCHLVIEAKRLNVGVESARDQAIDYVEKLGTPRDIVVTDGVRYRMYSCDREFASVAYANLLRPKESAQELFSRMAKT